MKRGGVIEAKEIVRLFKYFQNVVGASLEDEMFSFIAEQGFCTHPTYVVRWGGIEDDPLIVQARHGWYSTVFHRIQRLIGPLFR
jgi:hypothetical protein